MRKRENEHPFYRPLWVRLTLVGTLLVWTGVEWSANEPFWGVLTTAATAWAIWSFFISYDPDAATGGAPQRPADEPGGEDGREDSSGK